MTRSLFSRWAWGAVLALSAGAVWAEAPSPGPQRVEALKHMVRQDCGSCHGMRLTGGLGPALTSEALAHKPPEYLQAVILNGIPGTPMPPWSAMLSPQEAQWIAEQLFQGFPEEHRSAH
ncbi:c-type cytochrome [Comamonas nitrativorans]|uniref:C-type cytochrome n=1 Tax=Comamonas nitrativorans TaxID=108437 RepID=A0ABV9GXC5_9BURK|nr:cytochrome c [Comamonas sp.]